MMIIYRVMGVISCLALTLYSAVFAVLIAVFHINLSLPGIAGIILTVGMAVDANVVIFERIKEELHLGKTLRYAIDAGYKGALRAIIDAQYHDDHRSRRAVDLRDGHDHQLRADAVYRRYPLDDHYAVCNETPAEGRRGAADHEPQGVLRVTEGGGKHGKKIF